MAVADTPKGRSRADGVLLSALAAGCTAGEAADVANVSERTVRRRLADADFVARMESARQEVADAVLARVSASALLAVETLTCLLEPAQPPSVRLGAAKAVLDFGIRLRSERDVHERLVAIEEHLATIERNEKWET
jgi:hypothetical protein